MKNNGRQWPHLQRKLRVYVWGHFPILLTQKLNDSVGSQSNAFGYSTTGVSWLWQLICLVATGMPCNVPVDFSDDLSGLALEDVW